MHSSNHSNSIRHNNHSAYSNYSSHQYHSPPQHQSPAHHTSCPSTPTISGKHRNSVRKEDNRLIDKIRRGINDKLTLKSDDRNQDVDSDWCRFSDAVLGRNSEVIRRLIGKIESDIDVTERLTAVIWENLRNPVSNPLVRQDSDDVCHPCKRQYLSMHTGRCIHRIIKVYKLLAKCGISSQLLLYTAIEKQAVEVVRFLLNEAGADVNGEFPPNSLMTPILYALDPASQFGYIHAGQYKRRLSGYAKEDFPRVCMEEVISHQDPHVELIEALVRAGADLNYKDPDGNAAIHRLGFCKYDSAKHTDTRVLKILLSSHNVDINLEGVAGYSPLHIYAMRNAEEEVRLLIDEGANLDAHNDENDAPIHVAMKWSHPKIADILIKAGCDVNKQGAGGNTPLHYCAMKSDWTYLLQLLIQFGAIINITNDKEEAPLHLAVKYPQVFMLLVDHGALVNKQRTDGSTVLHMFARMGQYENVQCMLEADADVNLATVDGEIPLHLTVDYPHIMRLLLDSGSKVDKQGLGGNTALHYCSLTGNLEGVQVLLSSNVDVNAVNDTGDTPLHISVKFPDIIRALLDAGAHPTPVNCVDRTPLHCAALELENAESWYSIVESLDLLVSSPGCDVGIIDRSGSTALHYLAAIHKLHKRCSDSTLAAAHGSKDAAAGYDLLRIIRRLLELEPNCLHIQDSKGYTPLHVAVEAADAELVELLLDARADCSLQNKYGQSALDIAKAAHVREAAPEIHALLLKDSSRNCSSRFNAAQVVSSLHALLNVVSSPDERERLSEAIETVRVMLDRYGNKMGMSAEHSETLKRCRSALIEELSPMYICDALCTENILSEQQIDEIRRAGSRRLQSERLVDFILHNNDQVFDMFFLTLQRTRQNHVVDIICQHAVCVCHQPDDSSVDNLPILMNGTRPSSRDSVI